MRISYVFLEPTEYIGRDDERGEEYFVEDEFSYEFEPTEQQLRKAAVYVYSAENKPVLEQIKDLLEELVKKDDEDFEEMEADSKLEFKSIDEAIDKVFGKIEDFMWGREDDLKDYFEDDAREQFRETL